MNLKPFVNPKYLGPSVPWTAAVATLLVMAACTRAPEEPDGRVSSFGEYSGYSEARYDDWNRYSVYVPARDGTRIAVDYYLPTAADVEATEPLPVILHYTRYVRAFETDEGLRTRVDGDPVLQHMLKHGYAVAVADAYGSGASFGYRDLDFSAAEAAASHDVIEWLAGQPWCDGNVGMHGRSYPGMTQYQAATQAPPHLKAIFPEMADGTSYDFVYRGGTYKSDFIQVWGGLTRSLDLGEAGTPARVDADEDASLRDAAIAEHASSTWASELPEEARYRDFVAELPSGGTLTWEQITTLDDIAQIDASGVAVYHLLGWLDIYTTQQAWMYANLESGPQKMMIGPWVHSGGYGGEVHIAEFHRWYDFWLKGIQNGIMDEPPVHYFVMEGNNTVPEGDGQDGYSDEDAAEDEDLWLSANEWPLPRTSPVRYYLVPGPTGSVASVNDGGLRAEVPTEVSGLDAYTVDFTSSVGSFSRWMNGYGSSREDPEGSTQFDERTLEDEKALTYTTSPLEEDLVLVGYPVVRLWVTSTHSDGDFFVYLEEIDAEGRSHYVTEGAQRASYRRVAEAPWDNFGLPFHRGYEEDLEPLPAEPAEMAFELMGTAVVIDAGHRLRLTIAGADAANHAPYPDPESGAPTVSVYRNATYPSSVELPRVGRN
jgi:putative CocE/NonD family hydrolase